MRIEAFSFIINRLDFTYGEAHEICRLLRVGTKSYDREERLNVEKKRQRNHQKQVKAGNKMRRPPQPFDCATWCPSFGSHYLEVIGNLILLWLGFGLPCIHMAAQPSPLLRHSTGASW